MRNRFVTFLVGLVSCFFFSNIAAQAQDNKLPAVTLAAFQASPDVILETYPSGGPEMVSFIARALASDNELLDEILSLTEKANDEQKAAIGAGLGRIAKLCEALPEGNEGRQVCIDRAEAIARAVAETNNPIVMASFAVGTGDTPAAIATGGQTQTGGAPGGGGNVGRSASGIDGSDSGDSAVKTGSTDYFNSGNGNSYTGGSGGTSVSPTS